MPTISVFNLFSCIFRVVDQAIVSFFSGYRIRSTARKMSGLLWKGECVILYLLFVLLGKLQLIPDELKKPLHFNLNQNIASFN